MAMCNVKCVANSAALQSFYASFSSFFWFSAWQTRLATRPSFPASKHNSHQSGFIAGFSEINPPIKPLYDTCPAPMASGQS